MTYPFMLKLVRKNKNAITPNIVNFLLKIDAIPDKTSATRIKLAIILAKNRAGEGRKIILANKKITPIIA
jgi:hypothetical protein